MRVRLANFLATTATTIAGTFIPLYAHQLGADDVGVGLLAAITALATVLTNLICGHAADRYGTRAFIVFGLLASAISTLVQIAAFDFGSLVLLRVLNGLALGVYPAALISHVQASKERLGRFSAFGSLGWTVGSLLAGTIATYFTIRGTFVAASLLFFVAYLLAMRFGVRPPDPNGQQTVSLWQVFLRHRSTFISVMIRHIGAHMIWAFWPLFLQRLGADYFWIGVTSAINTGTQFVVMYFLTDRAWSTGLLRLGLFLSSVTFITFALAPTFWWILPTQVLLGISWATLYVGGLRAATEGNPNPGAASAIFTSVLNISMVIGPALGAALVPIGGYYALIWVGAALSFVAFLYRQISLVRARACRASSGLLS
uniref:Transporter, major facilitator family n=1 Tax=Acetithermum autotrophicum TaxID=1446466 RepID=H5SUN7_ACEAU|nr:transporter, major facilitator family [Candidatus Acetothermum autotrophicum]